LIVNKIWLIEKARTDWQGPRQGQGSDPQGQGQGQGQGLEIGP